MTAHTPIALDPLDTFIPGCGGQERALRGRLLRARDLASSRVCNLESAHARQLCWMVIETTTKWAFRPAPMEDLQATVNHVLRLTMCASHAEQECD